MDFNSLGKGIARLAPRKLKAYSRQLGSLEKRVAGLTALERRAFRSGVRRVGERLDSFAGLLKARRYGGLDEFFYSREDLPFSGKEYWFMDFASRRGRDQLIITFGRSERAATVNGKRATGEKVAAVGWMHSAGSTKTFLEDAVPLRQSFGSLETRAFSFKGSYPSYELRAPNTHLILKPQRFGSKFEVRREFFGGLGLGYTNLFLDATGTLAGRPFSGSGYVQKVVAVVPFIPWNWVRVTYPDRSGFDYFAPRVGLYPATANWWGPNGRSRAIRNASLERLGPDRWLLEGGEFHALLRGYASKPFVLRGGGTFHYDEFLVECVDSAFGGRERGKGIGIVEDAYGLML